MTPAARIQSAIEILDQVLSGAPTEQALIRWARGSRFAGSKDRAAIRDHVFDAVRCKRSYAALGGSETGRGLMIGALIAQEIEPGDIFSGQKYAPQALSSAEIESFRDLDSIPEAQRIDLPDWLWEKFQSSLGAEAWDTANALRDRAKVFLRVNVRKASIDQAIESLKKSGIEAVPNGLSVTALEVLTNPRQVHLSQAYSDGLVELQDAASQAVCDFLNLPDQGCILDYCAGGGGKSLAIAARSSAKIIAHDADPKRMSDLPIRAERADVSIAVKANIAPDEKYNLVFCDVPCSGSGSWRRSPDGKWSLTPEKLDNLLTVQSGILDDCAKLVTEGGELAYATCSVFSDENSAQIGGFLKRNAEWSLISERQFLPSDGGDGFYVARLVRA